MRTRFRPGRSAALALPLLLSLAGTPALAADSPPPAAGGSAVDEKARARCEERADQRQLADKARDRFMSRCVERVSERQISRQQVRGQFNGPGRATARPGG